MYLFLISTHVWCSSGNGSLLFSFWSSCSSHSSLHISFFTPCFHFSFRYTFFVFYCFFFSLWSVMFCCVLVPGTLELHLLHLHELCSFGLLCCTDVCDPTEFVSEFVSLLNYSAQTLGVLISLGKMKGIIRKKTQCCSSWCTKM